jgi:CheY-like chemotaxis protein
MNITKAVNQPSYKYPAYPPSILIIEDSASQPDMFKQSLKNSDCQVTRSDLSIDSLNLAHQKYFDLIVLNLNRSELVGFAEVWKKLKNDPQLAEIPVAIIASPHQAKVIFKDLITSTPIYYLPKDPLTETGLLRIINQVHYMKNRYN